MVATTTGSRPVKYLIRRWGGKDFAVVSDTVDKQRGVLAVTGLTNT